MPPTKNTNPLPAERSNPGTPPDRYVSRRIDINAP
jgi:hypothetical protein